MKRTVIVGLGRSGIGAAKLLSSKGIPTTLIESGITPELEKKADQLRLEGIEVHLGLPLKAESFRAWHGDLDTVVISPGIAWDHPTLTKLRADGITVQGEIALAWQSLRHLPWIGITGTNGKTTVTHLLSHVLQTAGLRAPMGGNMGMSAAEMALQLNHPKAETPDWLVMELSSYQIEAATEIAPRIGLWTTLTPDHLERHGTLEAYRMIKRGLLERSELAIFNADDPDLRQQRSSWDRGVWVSAEGPQPGGQAADLWIDADGMVQTQTRRLFPAEALRMPGEHNRQNMLMVTAAAQSIGLNTDQIEAGLRSFPGVPHRLEHIGTIGDLAIFNDSKATNYDAAEVALRAMQSPAVVLAGGQTKQGDAQGWLQQLQKKACAVVLFGAGAQTLHELIADGGNFCGLVESCPDLESAVDVAVSTAKRLNAACLLLSPACASFDQYSDFEARGEHFRHLIRHHQINNHSS